MNERQSCKRVGEQQWAVRRVGSLLFATSLAALKRGGEGREGIGGKGRKVRGREGKENGCGHAGGRGTDGCTFHH